MMENNSNHHHHHHHQQFNNINNNNFNYQQNHLNSLKAKLSSEENINFDAFLESSQFLTDPYVKSLIDKAITLGIVWEVIKETLGRFLLNSMVNTSNQTTEFDLNIINYSRLIDEEKFFEQLIMYSIQIENNSGSKQQHQQFSNKNEFSEEYNENDDNENDYDSISNNNELVNDQLSVNENEFDLGNQFSRININESNKIINRPTISNNLNTIAAAVANANKKIVTQPLTPQQKIQQEQDFITQSINRINDKSNLRPIIVDSNDVALSSHSNKQVFMFSRIKQVVDYFEKRNHQIYVILSSWRKEQIMASVLALNNNNNSSSINTQASSSSSLMNSQQQQQQQQQLSSSSTNPLQSIQQQQLSPDQLLLLEMEQKNQVYYTPSKRVGAKRIVCDDDSYMLKLAVAKMAIIVSNDNFKRFLNHSDDFKLVIEERVLMYSFIDGTFMPAEDPLGKSGPSLDNFLRFESFVNQQYMKRCPYRKKCTYGSKCKFWHPERGLHQGNQLFKTAHQSVLDEAQEQKMRLEIILNKNSYLTNAINNKLNNHQSIYNVENDVIDNDDQFSNNNDDIKYLNNRLKQQQQHQQKQQQQHQYSGLMSSANIYNLHDLNAEKTWSLNKADSDMSFINKTNQNNQHVQSFQKMSMYTDKFQGSGSLRAMGPDSQLKMTALNSSQNKTGFGQPKMNSINSLKNNQSLNPNSLIYTPTNMGLWDVMKSSNNNSNNNQNKNEFNFDSLNHQTGIQQQLMKLNEKKVEVTDTFSLFAPTPQTVSNVSSSTPNSVSPPLLSTTDKSLRAQLLAQNFNPKLVDDVLNKYKGESDIDKLIFLARGISFSSDF